MPGVAPGSQYDDGADKALVVVVQIESRPGVENVEKIAQVEGVDVLFIGELLLSSLTADFVIEYQNSKTYRVTRSL